MHSDLFPQHVNLVAQNRRGPFERHIFLFQIVDVILQHVDLTQFALATLLRGQSVAFTLLVLPASVNVTDSCTARRLLLLDVTVDRYRCPSAVNARNGLRLVVRRCPRSSMPDVQYEVVLIRGSHVLSVDASEHGRRLGTAVVRTTLGSDVTGSGCY
jgi:hypothetical protein